MKTMKTTIIAVALTVLASFAYGSGNVKLNMNQTEADRAFVEISNATLTQFEIKVEDVYGDLIFRKKTMEPATSYRKNYDFSALDDGIYTLSVKSEKETNMTKFQIERNEINILEERKVVEPHFAMDGNNWKMSYLNFPMEKTNIYIYDGSQLVYTKSIDPTFAIHEGLDLSKLIPGDYQVVFTTPQDIFEHDVTVN
ncbi:T9SS type A sorting domain-containing protein [Mariniphaga sp.]|uniref:T9SS type A sorting domain-containing protein n=1 Tax=Mariniphaga sp. TaxID=1954475 RepID=UPI0035633039